MFTIATHAITPIMSREQSVVPEKGMLLQINKD
jgi:hypothetical protein